MPDRNLETTDSEWRKALLEGDERVRHLRHLFGLLPADPRCKSCHAPFKGLGGLLMRVLGRPQSTKNPLYCEPCVFHQAGGADVEATMLFADVRGSTALAESMPAGEYKQLISRFYRVATDALVRSDALIDRLMGDQVIGLYVPGFAGPDHARKAIQAALELSRRTGNASPKGPWIPLGIGLHTGVAYVGVVKGGPEGLFDFTMLGDNVNVTARLASSAAAGEILVSDAAYAASSLELGELERRRLMLKGKTGPVDVRVLKPGAAARKAGGASAKI